MPLRSTNRNAFGRKLHSPCTPPRFGRWFALGVVTGLFFGRRHHWTALLALVFVAASEIAGAAYLP